MIQVRDARESLVHELPPNHHDLFIGGDDCFGCRRAVGFARDQRQPLCEFAVGANALFEIRRKTCPHTGQVLASLFNQRALRCQFAQIIRRGDLGLSLCNFD